VNTGSVTTLPRFTEQCLRLLAITWGGAIDIRVVNPGFAIRKRNTRTQIMEIGDLPMARRLRSVTCETGERNMSTHVVLNLKTTKMPRLAMILITLIGSASLCIAPLAFAQSDGGATPSVSESDVIPGPPAPVPGDLAGPPTSATDGSSGATDDSSAPPASHTDWEQVPEANSDATSGGDGQVLEVPQSVNPDQAAARNSDDNSPAQGLNDGQDELGGLNGYLGENADLPGGYYIPVPAPVPVGPGFAGVPMREPVQPAGPGMSGVGPISPRFPGGGFRPTPTTILRPGGLGGIPSTSPMLTPPLGSAAMPGGSWNIRR
jgi:hypothetical protein